MTINVSRRARRLGAPYKPYAHRYERRAGVVPQGTFSCPSGNSPCRALLETFIVVHSYLLSPTSYLLYNSGKGGLLPDLLYSPLRLCCQDLAVPVFTYQRKRRSR